MHHIFTDRPLLFFAHNCSDVVHWGEVGEMHNISTGQPELETFELDDRDSWVARLLELGVSEEEISPTDLSEFDPSRTEVSDPIDE